MKKLNQLFDIAHSNAMNMMTKDGQTFLANQRSEKREGGLAGVNKKAMQKEKRRNNRIGKETERKRRHYENERLPQQGNTSNIPFGWASHKLISFLSLNSNSDDSKSRSFRSR